MSRVISRVKPSEESCAPATASPAGKNLLLGPLLMMSAALSIALVASLIKWASPGFSTEFILAVRFAVSLLIILALQPKAFLGHLAAALRPSLMMAQGLSFIGASFSFYLSIRYVPMVDAILLFNSAPFFAPLFSWMIFKKAERPLVWLGIAIGMAGVALVLKPGTEGFQPAALLSLLAGAFVGMQMAINASLVEHESKQRISTVVQLYGLFLTGIATLFVGVGPADWQQMLFSAPDWGKPWLELPWLALAAVAAGGLSVLFPILSTSSFQFGSVGQVAPFMYTSIVFTGFIGWLVWGTVPSLTTLAGFFLIVAGGIGALLGGRQPQPQPH